MVGGWPSCEKEGLLQSPPYGKGGWRSYDDGVHKLSRIYFTIFIAGIVVGKLVEKIERFLRRKEDEEHNGTNKNDRR